MQFWWIHLQPSATRSVPSPRTAPVCVVASVCLARLRRRAEGGEGGDGRGVGHVRVDHDLVRTEMERCRRDQHWGEDRANKMVAKVPPVERGRG